MKVAVLSINIGNYIVFWHDLYQSSRRFFLPGSEKEYFVFTDQERVDFSGRKDVHVVRQEDLGWPGNTLFRFQMFCGIECELSGFDYVFFMNANLLFYKPIGTEILPVDPQKLVFVRRNSPYLRKEAAVPYEDNPQSTAYVKHGESELYVRGGFNGGVTSAYLSMCHVLDENIKQDLKKNIIAKWHDESHLTRYAIGRDDIKVLSAGYLYPLGWVMPYAKEILLRPKDNASIRFGTGKNIFQRSVFRIFLFLRNMLYTILIRTGVIKYEEKTGKE